MEERWCSPGAWSKMIIYQARYRKTHASQKARDCKAYRSVHPELLAYWRKYNATHRSAISTKKHAYHLTHRAARATYMQEYHSAHPDIARTNNIKRKNKTRIDPTANPAIIRQFYLMRDRVSQCTGIPFHVDHITPLSKGGLHHEGNLQVLPAGINLRKSSRLLPADQVISPARTSALPVLYSRAANMA